FANHAKKFLFGDFSERKELFLMIATRLISHGSAAKRRSDKVAQGGNASGAAADQYVTAFLTSTEESWHADYVGDYHLVILAILDSINEARKEPYSNTVAMIQSSGTGKSRACDEVAKLRFTFPMCLRPLDADGYPDSDRALVKFFQRTLSSGQSLKTRYLAFLASLFEEAVVELRKLVRKPGDVSALASVWRDHLSAHDGAQREDFYNRVVHWETIEKLDMLKEPELILRVHESTQALLDYVVKMTTVFGDDARHPPGRNTVKILIYVDEAHTLTEHGKNKDNTESGYNALCAALDAIVQFDVLTLFLSTSSELSTLSPSQGEHPSMRVRTIGLACLNPPIVELPFDAWRGPNGESIVRENQFKLTDACTLEVMSRFGRVLFWTRLASKNPSVKNDLLNFAKLKISGDRHYEASASSKLEMNEIRNITILSIRIILDFEPSCQSTREMESTLVRGHMRLAYSVPRHREFLRSGTSSEPILAEAAAQLMHIKRPHEKPASPTDWASFLGMVTENGFFNKGQSGEIAMRLLATFAHDRAIGTLKKPAIGDPHYDRPIPLTAFLEALFSEKVANEILDSTPTNQTNGKTLREAFKGAHVRFTHFWRVGDASMISDDGMWRALARGFAVQCADGQPFIDMAIPIQLDLDTPLGRFGTWGKTIPFFSDEIPGASPESCSRPYIVMTANLGVKSGSVQVEQSPARNLTHHSGVVHPRYAFNVLGCSSDTFRVIGSEESNQPWIRLLHAHGDTDDCIAALRHLGIDNSLKDTNRWAEPQVENGAPTSSFHFAAKPTSIPNLNPNTVANTPMTIHPAVTNGLPNIRLFSWPFVTMGGFSEYWSAKSWREWRWRK
ncbi:hypothetical protein BXZ70DRAFT_945159, partial [Cristinia sonorae]